MVGVPSALCVRILQEQAWNVAATASAAQAYRSNGLAAVRGLVHVVGGSGDVGCRPVTAPTSQDVVDLPQTHRRSEMSYIH
jgi:hypothetical protein